MAYQYLGFYPGLDPNAASAYREVSTSYSFPASRLGAATSVQTSNQIAEVEARLKEGMSTIEVQPIGEGILETIPKEQFKEINQLAKLANADITMHGPMIDPSGFTRQGWSEYSRAQAESQLLDAVKRAHELNPEGNIPVTIHASAIPAAEWKKEKGIEEKEMMVVVNPESGEISPMRKEAMYYPEREEKIIFKPEDMLNMSNASQWRNTLLGVQEMKRHGDDMLTRALVKPGGVRGAAPTEEELMQKQKDLGKVDLYYHDVELKLSSMFDLAYKSGDENVKQELQKIRQDWMVHEKEMANAAREGKGYQIPLMKQDFFDNMVVRFGQLGAHEPGEKFPIRMLQPIEDFAIKHASETIGNVAFKAYSEFKETAPIVSVENFMPNLAFSRGEQLANLIKESRNKFVDAAVRSGMNGEKARKESEKLIGATWDVGHINLLRKSGFTDEDIIAETKKVAKFVKHAHIADNFGFEETHLPPGMGNVPIKEMMKELEKAGFKGKAIVEAGNFVAQFKTSPHPYAIENLNSPIYTPQTGPTWGAARGLYGEGPVSYGVMFPEQHFAMYGAGFSALPSSLGGQIPGKQSRFSGAPME